MVRDMYDMMRFMYMRTCFSIRGGVCDTYEMQGNFRDSK